MSIHACRVDKTWFKRSVKGNGWLKLGLRMSMLYFWVLDELSINWLNVIFLQVFDFQHGFLFGEMHCLQISAVYSVIAPPLELSFWGSAPTPVLQVTQGSRHWHCHHTQREPTNWLQRQTEKKGGWIIQLFLEHHNRTESILMSNGSSYLQ